MREVRIENLREWLRKRIAIKLMAFVALGLAISAVFFRDFWSSLPAMLSPSRIFGQTQASPWGVLALCLLFLWLKREGIWAQMHLRTNPVYAMPGLVMLAAAILLPYSEDYLVFQVMLAFLGIFTILFGSASRFPAICLTIYVLAVSFPLIVERFAEDAYSRTAITPIMGLITILGLPFRNQGQWLDFVSVGGEQIKVVITAACAGPATMGVFLALFTLMMMDMPLKRPTATWVFFFGVAGTWLQSVIRLIFLLLVGYYFGGKALQTAHIWTIYILFPLWFLLFAWIYLRQVKRPSALWGKQQPNIPAGGI